MILVETKHTDHYKTEKTLASVLTVPAFPPFSGQRVLASFVCLFSLHGLLSVACEFICSSKHSVV